MILKNTVAVKATLLLASMMTILANAIIAPALPEINKAFSAVPNSEIWCKLLMTLPALTIVIFASTIGTLIDRFGRLKILFIALFIFAIAGTSGLWLNTLPQILVGRFFLGFGVAGIMTAATTLIGDYFKGNDRNKFVSLQGAFSGFGGLLFITLSGYLADVHWRWPFAIYGFSIVVFGLGYAYLVEPKKEKEGKEKAVIADEALDIKSIYTIYATAFVGIILFYILPLQIPFYIKSLGNLSNSMSGLAIGALTTSQAIASFFYRKLKAKYKYMTIYSISFSIMAVGYLFISLSDAYWQIIIGLIVSGIGIAWLMPNGTLWLMSITPENKRGRYIGRLTTFIFLGQFASPIMVQPLQSLLGLQNTFLSLSLFLILLAVIYLVISFSKSKEPL